MKVTVTAEDIKKGCQAHRNRCPIALALKRLGMKGVKVGTFQVELDGSDVYPLPVEAQRFIRKFDYGAKVNPFTFTMRMEGS